MASKYLEIIADIKGKMESVPDIGKVYDYYRWNADFARFVQLFSYTPSTGGLHIRGWEITRKAAPEHKRGAWFRHHKFTLTGYMGLKDDAATDKVFQVLVDDVCELFRNTAGGATWDYMDGEAPENSPAQTPLITPRMFGSVLCHVAEIDLSVQERII